MDELIEWLNANKIQYSQIDEEVIDIIGVGQMFLVDTESNDVESVFKKAKKDEEIQFNLTIDQQVLFEESIFYAAFKFGDNWYYYDLRGKFAFNIIQNIGQHHPYKKTVDFVNLGAHTPYELLNGSGSVQEWVSRAKFLGHKGLGICDKNTMGATILLQQECEKQGLQYVFGYTLDIRREHDPENPVPAKVYCLTQEGLQNMLRIQKTIMVDSEDLMISLPELARYAKGNVLVIGTLATDWMFDDSDGNTVLSRPVVELQKHFDSVYYQVDLSEYKADRIDVMYLEAVKDFFNNSYLGNGRWAIEPILICDQYYVNKSDYRNKINLNKVSTRAAHNQSHDQYFKDIDDHWETFSGVLDDAKWDVDGIFKEMCARTVDIACAADAKFDTSRNFMPQYSLTDEELEKYGDRHNMFRQLLEEGFERLVPFGKEKEYRERLEREIYVLESTNNVDYMLVQYDTVNWARSQNILVGAGRGSAGGSLVLYLLGITLVDPMKYDLLFERFLLPERAGLYQADVTRLVEPIEDTEYVEVTFDNEKTYKFACDALLLVKEGDEYVEVYADELRDGDEIIFDNRDLLWGLI